MRLRGYDVLPSRDVATSMLPLLQQKLHSVQEEIHAVTLQLNKLLGESKSCGPSEVKLLQTLDELKEEFSELMRELRRRKSLADGIVLNNQDEDMDGELRRRPRRLTLTTPGRRASLSTMVASTTRPLATPTISHHAFVVSTPNLQAAEDFSPTSSQTKSNFLQVAQSLFFRSAGRLFKAHMHQQPAVYANLYVKFVGVKGLLDGRKFGDGVPAQCRHCHLITIQNYEVLLRNAFV
ncbi:hypothetical protein AVEN_76019-1 [Araneus ventricosus]|uniref:Uncharacterized protein n=1 Tax=Araneus ventricosus TaxID=182803 RepID=A0A4Y2UHA3_ARAVE|nr:hypothetical protein AVEN_76019-1 [Araneus ventricosus]